MDKILINLYVPAIHEYYDIFVPHILPVKDICKLLGKAIEELSNRQYITSGEEILCSAERQNILNPDWKLIEYGIQNGEHLLFF